MNMKKTLASVLAGIMVLSMAACGGSSSSASTGSSAPAASAPAASAPAASAPAAPAETPAETYNVGICQLVQHPALDAATQGFIDALTEKLGDAVVIDNQNASGDSQNCTTIVNGFVSADYDLIMANATPALQAAQAGTSTIPILATSITDYGTALGIDFSGTTGINVSGTTDLAPLDGQAQIINEMFPDAKNIGLLYCSAEANSIYQINVIKGYLEQMGYTCTEFSFTDSNDVASVTESAASSVDVVYIPTDNTAASYTETIANVLIPAGIPAVVGEEGICTGCGVATLTISYYDIGYATGEMAYEILANGADVSAMEIQAAPQFTKKYNAVNCEALGITPPADYEAIEG